MQKLIKTQFKEIKGTLDGRTKKHIFVAQKVNTKEAPDFYLCEARENVKRENGIFWKLN